MGGGRQAPVAILLGIVLLASGCVDAGPDEEDAPHTPPAEPALLTVWDALDASPAVVFETDHGTIRLLLYDVLMPQTAARFQELVGQGFYDETLIHRVVDDFVIQGGDPSKTGWMGSGETIPFESDDRLLFGAGAVGLARDVDPDSGDSQWFITELPAPHLSDPSQSSLGDVFGSYALFAQVYEGMDVVRSIAAVPVVPGADRPIEDVYLQRATIEDPPPIDLTLLPPTIEIGGPGGAIVEHPLHLLDGHAFPLTVYLEKDEETTPPETVPVSFQRNNTTIIVSLTPLADDPWVFHDDVRLPHPGTWDRTIETPAGDWTGTVLVNAMHQDYERFMRGP